MAAFVTYRRWRLRPGIELADVVDLATGEPVGEVDDLGGFSVDLDAFGGLALGVRAAEPEAQKA